MTLLSLVLDHRLRHSGMSLIQDLQSYRREIQSNAPKTSCLRSFPHRLNGLIEPKVGWNLSLGNVLAGDLFQQLLTDLRAAEQAPPVNGSGGLRHQALLEKHRLQKSRP